MNSLEPLLLSLWKDLHNMRLLWQLLAVAASLAAAWWISRLLRPRLVDPAVTWRYGADGLRSVAFPAGALLLLLIARWTLAHYQSVSLLNLAVPVLVALVLIRIIFYMLKPLFAPDTAVSALLRAIAWAIWLGAVLHITGLAPDLIEFLDDIGLGVGKQRISLLMVLQATLSIVVALVLSLWLGRVLEGRLTASSMNTNLRVMLTKLMRPLLVFIAIMVTLPAVGVDITALSVFSGALGVGIGFGLQKITSNYISGFIILLDRSVNIGDFLTIDNHSGQLTKLTARYLVIRSAGGMDVIIPNETVITSTVVNHSYSDTTVRVAVALQISYRSDLDEAMRVLVEVAQAHPRVLASPAPKVLIRAFAESGIDLELGVWIDDPETGRANVASDIFHAVWREFRARGIEIPYPQREVRLLGGSAPPGAAFSVSSDAG